MEEQSFKVRDRRNKGWFYLDNEYLNGYAKIFGAIGTAIYVSLCRHADENQRCFPSQKLIAEELSITDRTVRSYLDSFEKWRLIHIERERDEATKKWKNNVYYLLDKSEWVKPDASQRKPIPMEPEETDDTSQRKLTTDSQRKQFPHKDTNVFKNTHIKNTKEENTPKQTAQTFFSSPSFQEKVVSTLVVKGVPENIARAEIKKFISYWTESNGSGTKQRWQLEKVFDVSRRLTTWFSNIQKFQRSSFTKETKGITL